MSTAIPNLWPADLLAPTMERTPLAILKEQAAQFSSMTRNLLEGRVDTTIHVGVLFPGDELQSRIFRHVFSIIAPTLEGYKYELLAVAHRVEPYPLIAHFYSHPSVNPESKELSSEAEFVDYLRQVFASTESRSIISALLAQVGSSGRMIQGLLNVDKLPNGNILITFAPNEGQGNSRPLLVKDPGQAESDLVRTFGLSPLEAHARIAEMERKGQTSAIVTIDEELAATLFLHRRI